MSKIILSTLGSKDLAERMVKALTKNSQGFTNVEFFTGSAGNAASHFHDMTALVMKYEEPDALAVSFAINFCMGYLACEEDNNNGVT